MFHVGGGRKMNFCNTLDTFSSTGGASTLPGTSSSKKRKKKSLRNTETLDGTWGLPAKAGNQKKSSTGLGHHAYTETWEFNALTYVQEVKDAFHNNPDKYLEFKELMQDIKDQSSNKVDVVNRVINLLGHRSDLIKGFGFFLPPNMTLLVQDDAVIVNVQGLEALDDTVSKPSTFGERHFEQESDEEAYKEEPDEANEDPQTMQYLRNAKWTFMHQKEVYDKLLSLIKGLQKGQLSVLYTANEVVKLLGDHEDLVLGFNVFLKGDYKIFEHHKYGFVLKNPCYEGEKVHFTQLGTMISENS